MNTKSVIKNYLTNNVSNIASVVIFSLLAITFKILNPIFMKLVIDYSVIPYETDGITEYGNPTMVILFTVLMGASTILALLFDSIKQTKSTSFGNDMTSELRSLAYQTVIKSELYEISKISNEDLCDTIVNSTSIIGDKYISGKLIKLFYNALYLVALMITMFVFNSTFAFITLVSLPIFYLLAKYLGKLSEKRTEVYKKTNDKHQYIIKDHTEQLKTIKTRNGIKKEEELYESLLKENKKAFSKNVTISSASRSFVPTMFVSILWFALLLITVVDFFAADPLTYITSKIGSFVACIAISPKIITTFKTIYDLYVTQINVDAEIAKLDRIYAIKLERRSENVPSLEEIHSLKFNTVSFDYVSYGVNNKVTLDKIDFEIKKGEKLGIVGLAGSGKTTIADLITKVIRPRQGNVLINNCDINKLNTYYLRDIVTYVPQDYKLIDASIEENVIYPLPLDEYKYNDALNKCKLKDLIFSLPQRDATNARNANLSASDIQKISLANAFYKESSIIILDEATSKLDPITENEVMEEFLKLKNKISIIMTSRISSVVKCDKVLILSNGKVVEYGKVSELLENKSSSFAKMVSDDYFNKKVV